MGRRSRWCRSIPIATCNHGKTSRGRDISMGGPKVVSKQAHASRAVRDVR
jgi:hypothetical protein